MESIAFICGCGHSGTSLIANMFAAHPDVHVPLEETKVFLTEDDEVAARKFAHLVGQAEEAGKHHLVEKTPRHVRKIDLIRRTAPTARFVLPVRDGRDVTASFKRRHGRPRRAIQRWVSDNAIVRAEQGKPDVIAYRHEDLVANPERMVRVLCAFLEIPFREEMLHYHETPRLWFRQDQIADAAENHDAHRNWQVNQPIFDSSGKWRTELTEAEVGLLMADQARELMEAFAYLDHAEPATTPAEAAEAAEAAAPAEDEDVSASEYGPDAPAPAPAGAPRAAGKVKDSGGSRAAGGGKGKAKGGQHATAGAKPKSRRSGAEVETDGAAA